MPKWTTFADAEWAAEEGYSWLPHDVGGALGLSHSEGAAIGGTAAGQGAKALGGTRAATLTSFAETGGLEALAVILAIVNSATATSEGTSTFSLSSSLLSGALATARVALGLKVNSAWAAIEWSDDEADNWGPNPEGFLHDNAVSMTAAASGESGLLLNDILTISGEAVADGGGALALSALTALLADAQSDGGAAIDLGRTLVLIPLGTAAAQIVLGLQIDSAWLTTEWSDDEADSWGPNPEGFLRGDGIGMAAAVQGSSALVLNNVFVLSNAALSNSDSALSLAVLQAMLVSALADTASAVDLSDIIVIALNGDASTAAPLTTLQRQAATGAAGLAETEAPAGLQSAFTITESALADSGGAISAAIIQRLATAARTDAVSIVTFARDEDIGMTGGVFFLVPAHRIFVVPV